MDNALLNGAEVANIDAVALKVGVRLYATAYEQALGKQYLSRVEIVGKDEVHVSMPMNHGVVMPLMVGSEVFFSYIVDNSRYAFKGQILYFAKNSINVAVLKYPTKIYSVDFRASFRVPIDQLVKIFVIDDGKVANSFCESSPTFYANCVNLSSDGARLATRSDLTKNEEFHLDISSLVQGLGLIGSSIVWHEKVNVFYHFGVKFFGMRDVDKDMIMKFLFKKQTDIRRSLKGGL